MHQITPKNREIARCYSYQTKYDHEDLELCLLTVYLVFAKMFQFVVVYLVNLPQLLFEQRSVFCKSSCIITKQQQIYPRYSYQQYGQVYCLKNINLKKIQVLLIYIKYNFKKMKNYMPKPYKKRRYYTLAELQQHKVANDAWVAFFDEIFDITFLIQSRRNQQQCEPLIAAAGTDITHWFDNKTHEPRKQINQYGKQEFYCPQGKFLDMEGKQDVTFIPWWKNIKYSIGKLTKKSQAIRIINTLSDTQDKLEVPQEQTIWEILDRYQQINFHAKSYTWKRKGKPLNMDMTLAENGIVDQSSIFEEHQVPEELQYIPAIHIHFNDDLTSQ